jgi:hypothetical protein
MLGFVERDGVSGCHRHEQLPHRWDTAGTLLQHEQSCGCTQKGQMSRKSTSILQGVPAMEEENEDHGSCLDPAAES